MALRSHLKGGKGTDLIIMDIIAIISKNMITKKP